MIGFQFFIEHLALWSESTAQRRIGLRYLRSVDILKCSISILQCLKPIDCGLTAIAPSLPSGRTLFPLSRHEIFSRSYEILTGECAAFL